MIRAMLPVGRRPTINKNNYRVMMAPCFHPFHTHRLPSPPLVWPPGHKQIENVDCRRLSAVESTDGMTSGYLPTMPSNCV